MMYRSLFTLLICILSTLNICAQECNDNIKRWDNGRIKSIKYHPDDNEVYVPRSEEDFFTNVLHVKNYEREFKEIAIKNRSKTILFRKYQQYYNGIKVEGGHYVFHIKNGYVSEAHGDYIPVNDINTVPSIALNEAINNLAKYLGKEIKDTIQSKNELIIKELPIVGNGIIRLVYKSLLLFSDKNANLIGYIDAHTGEVLYTESPYLCYSSLGTFSTAYNGQKQGYTEYDSNSGKYILIDTTRGYGIHVKNELVNSNDTEFMDNDNNWTYSEHGDDRIALDAFWAFQQIFDIFNDEFDLYSYDGMGGAIIAGICNNDTGYSPFFHKFFFNADNSIISNPQTSVDIVAHEFGHAVSAHTIGWTNNTDIEPMALHEGLSDIWSVIIGHRIGPNPNMIWKLGWQVVKSPWVCNRNVSDPLDNNATTQIASTYGVNLANSNDPHVVGGIFSRWFYFLVNGGTGTNEKGHSYCIYPVGFDLAEELIVNAVVNPYLTDCITFADVREALIDAATDMNNDYLVQQVENAWYAVGVGNKPSQIGDIFGNPLICSSSTFSIENVPSNGISTSWSITNGAFSLIPNGNQCTVSCNTTDEIGTLTAIISHNGQQIKTVSKQVYVHGSFLVITGTQEEYQSTSGYYPEQSISYFQLLNGNDTIYVNGDCDINLESSRFKGMNISFVGSYLPSDIAHNDSCLHFHTSECPLSIVPHPRGFPLFTLPYIIRLQARSNGGCFDFDVIFKVSPFPYINDPELLISANSTTLYAHLITAAPIPIGGGMSQQPTWTLRVNRVSTGQLMTSKTVTGADTSVDISSYASGLYVVTALFYGSTYSAKFVKQQ